MLWGVVKFPPFVSGRSIFPVLTIYFIYTRVERIKVMLDMNMNYLSAETCCCMKYGVYVTFIILLLYARSEGGECAEIQGCSVSERGGGRGNLKRKYLATP